MKKCFEVCKSGNMPCSKIECRQWINYRNDLNCTIVAVENNGDMTLKEIAKRLQVSIVRAKQIQDKALRKLQKKPRRWEV